ncbi:hypothetical protein BKA69DRAFT_1164299 [Paraphysoderma sedebokerense]|nr:hypothetical protein BKA69DRAFT_1122765 [Paraphysoderma sedebokerense]KAI9144419.1 hypothetical protein BKA69DRAFT_1164299 [Paraphysoderma sedebokerense]
MEIETTLLIVREVFVYKIPPRTTTRGYRAQEWDVNQFLWQGRLKVTAQGDKCFVKLEDPNTGELFALCNYNPDNNSVEPVLDSSRYFVLRIEDKGRHAYVGLGFAERNDAFDFNVALQDHVKHVKAQKEPKKALDPGPKLDLSLKEGETISINIGKIAKKPVKPSTNVVNDGSPAILPPRPSSSNSKSSAVPAFMLQSQSPPKPGGQDPFGAFQSAFATPANQNQGQNKTGSPGQGAGGWVQF